MKNTQDLSENFVKAIVVGVVRSGEDSLSVVEMDLEQFSDMTGDFRYATYQFIDPEGGIKWESNATGSVQEPQLVLTSPDSGTWRLLVDARGYGFELSNLATSKDKVSVWVIVETSQLVYSDGA